MKFIAFIIIFILIISSQELGYESQIDADYFDIKQQVVNSKKDSMQDHSGVIPAKTSKHTDIESSDDLNSVDQMISNDELLSLALTAVRGDDPDLAYEAFAILINLSPEESSRILHEISNQKIANPYLAEMVFTGMVHLQSDRILLPDGDVKKFYELDNYAVKKLAAKILSDRGDGSLANDYIKLIESGLLNKDSSIRLQTLFDISSLNQFDTLPQVRSSLSDPEYSIRLQALNILGAYGSDTDIAKVEPLLLDAHPQVRAQAELVISNLWHKNNQNTVSVNQEFAPPYDLN
jgi:HEAT repeats